MLLGQERVPYMKVQGEVCWPKVQGEVCWPIVDYGQQLTFWSTMTKVNLNISNHRIPTLIIILRWTSWSSELSMCILKFGHLNNMIWLMYAFRACPRGPKPFKSFSPDLASLSHVKSHKPYSFSIYISLHKDVSCTFKITQLQFNFQYSIQLIPYYWNHIRNSTHLH